MGKIRLMSTDLANKIAAGEVIENQASVVKELVENSIDANSTKIDVNLIDSGLQLIQVIDNGQGMSKDDLLLCFKQHATSKLTSKYDLFNIKTLGFRGEALSSIVSVAKVRISTNDQQSVGYNLDINENQLTQGYLNQGTKFSVYNLFYNVPARLKYLKSQKSELANIIDLIAKLALAYPNIAFTLTNDNKTLIKTRGNNDLLQIITNIYSLEIVKNLEEIKFKNSDFSVDGYISNNKATRSNKRGINIFLNNRLIHNKEIENAIIKGYGQYLMEKRYPIVILNIYCDFQLIDVNVHPAKKEVRISKIEELITLIIEAIENKFNLIQKRFIEKTSVYQPSMDFKYVTKAVSEGSLNYPSKVVKNNEEKNNNEIKETMYPKAKEMDVIQNDISNDLKNIIKNVEVQEEIKAHEVKKIESLMFENNNNDIQTIKIDVIGQYNASYIIGQSEKGLHLIDQHAAMERINYEKLKNNFKNEKIIYKDLLIPIDIPLTLAEKTKLLSLSKNLAQIGIHLEQQLNNDIIIRKIPTWIADENASEYVHRIFNYILEQKAISPLSIKMDDLILASCKMSLKANKVLTYLEQQELVDQLLKTDNYDHCPHGRPIIITYSNYDVEKLFKRIV